jgi:fermentation-respiration switch protein FrsA (DUF1100 family)
MLLWNKPGIVAKLISQPMNYTTTPISQLEMECFHSDEPLIFSYCINRIQGSKSKDIVYHFHGRKGNAKWWNDDTYYTGDLYRQWATTKTEAPIVVSISFGPLWLLDKESLLKFFEEKLVPQIESKLNLQIEKRLVVGESMGGVNAILAWLNTKALFDGAASLCAPLPTISPYASFSEIMEYIQNSDSTWQRGTMMLFIGRYLFPSKESWNNNSPIDLASRQDFTSSGQLYLSCGKLDDWGCTAGSNKFINAAKSNGADIIWHPTDGGHCDIDTMSLAKFLGGSTIIN